MRRLASVVALLLGLVPIVAHAAGVEDVASGAAAGLLAAEEDPPPRRERTDPNVPGGPRVGDDDRDDDFDGYPAGPGSPDDAYFDTTSEWRAYTPNWTGAFYGGGLIGGWLQQDAAFLGSPSSAPVYGAFLQASTVQLVLDFELSYLRFATEGSVNGATGTLDRSSWSLSALAHPFFLANIRGGVTSFLVPGFYALGGVSIDNTVYRVGAFERDTSEPGWHIGAGIDLPLDSPQDGGAFWAGLQFRHHRVTDDRNVVWLRDGLLTEDVVLLKIAYRRNGNVFSGMPGPGAP
jgi:hypothetical protein